MKDRGARDRQPSSESNPQVLLPTGTATERFRRRTEEPNHAASWMQSVQAHLSEQDRPSEPAHLAWEVAVLAPASVQRGVHLLGLLALFDLSLGSTRVATTVSGFPERLRELAPVTANGEQAFSEALTVLAEPALGAPAVAEAGGRAPLLIGQDSLQIERMAWLECRLAERLRNLTTLLVDRPEVNAAFARVRDRYSAVSRLTQEQGNAVLEAASRRLSVITGGPGTGKTSIVVSLIYLLQELGIELGSIAMAAPTGKATHRLASAVRKDLDAQGDSPRAETLHRLLGARPGSGRFAYNAEHPLPVRVVVCDEASMLDLELATRLVDALEEGTRLVLLGDVDQLPSVDAGAVLKELVDNLPEGVVCRLTHSFRMDGKDPAGRQVLQAAEALHRGDGRRFFELAGSEEPKPRSSGHPSGEPAEFQSIKPVRFLPVLSPSDRATFLRSLLRNSPLGDPAHVRSTRKIRRFVEGRFLEPDEAEVRRILERSAAFQLLTVTRQESFQNGSEMVSKSLHVLYAQREGFSEQESFLVGEPVMMLRNDYERRLFNGDIGVVLSVAVDHHAAQRMAVFPGEASPSPFDLMPLASDLVPAHAVTVHKAQGSEYDSVALLLPERDVSILTREVLYTAATRARSAVTIAGSPSILEQALKRRIERSSGLGIQLAALLE